MKHAMLWGMLGWSIPIALLASHTVDEQNSFVRNALLGVMSSVNDNMGESEAIMDAVDFNTWEGFLGIEESGWTMDEKKLAFLSFLNTMGTNDYSSASDMDKEVARSAVSQCRNLVFTNAVPALMSIGMNPNGICRRESIALAIQLGDLNQTMTTFVEDITTNVASFSFRERGTACGKFARKVCDLSKGNNSTNETLCGQATAMLYRNRKVDVAGAKMLDVLFCECYDGYSNSSNRLDFACYILGHSNCTDYDRRDFTIVTNQLLSSGQPLRWIDVGGSDR